ncbi:MAG: antitoxin Xre/MbcA/ParS toxin-binding domain-containing protein [Pyrinomonadaceae bacterium]
MNIEQKLNKEISTIITFSLTDPPLKRGRKTKKELTYSEFFSDKMMIISLIRIGVPYSLFELIKAVTPFSEGDWASFLSISNKSLVRYKQESRSFKPIQSEKILEMAEVAQAGTETFGDMERFKLWLDTPNFSLGNLKPIELLRDSYGKEMVIAELTRIDHGILV